MATVRVRTARRLGRLDSHKHKLELNYRHSVRSLVRSSD